MSEISAITTIKNMSVELREVALACAKARGISMAQWITEAVNAKLDSNGASRVRGQTYSMEITNT